MLIQYAVRMAAHLISGMMKDMQERHGTKNILLHPSLSLRHPWVLFVIQRVKLSMEMDFSLITMSVKFLSRSQNLM